MMCSQHMNDPCWHRTVTVWVMGILTIIVLAVAGIAILPSSNLDRPTPLPASSADTVSGGIPRGLDATESPLGRGGR